MDLDVMKQVQIRYPRKCESKNVFDPQYEDIVSVTYWKPM